MLTVFYFLGATIAFIGAVLWLGRQALKSPSQDYSGVTNLVVKYVGIGEPYWASGKQPELTDWFPPEIKPVYEGWYDTQLTGVGVCCRWWDGAKWWFAPNEYRLIFQHLVWRGLAEKPE